jgi:oligopeptidase B
MHKLIFCKAFIVAALLLGLTACDQPPTSATSVTTMAQKPDQASLPQPAWPVAARHDKLLQAHGLQRIDPYYWLRDDERKNPEVLAYLEAENDYLDQVMAGSQTLQEKLYQELISRIPDDDESVPFRYHGDWFARQYREGLELPIHVRWQRGDLQPEGEPEVLLDENQLKGDLDYYSVGEYDVSPDGRYLAWTEDTVSRGIYNLKFRDLQGQESLTESIEMVSSDVVFANDNRTVFYLKLQQDTLIPHQVWRHQLGTPASADVLVYEETDSSFQNNVNRSRDNRWVMIEQQSTTMSEVQLIPADQPQQAPQTLIPRIAEHEYSVNMLGDTVYVLSNEGAKNFRIIRAPIAQAADRQSWQEVLPARSDALIENFVVFDAYLAVQITEDANSKLEVINLNDASSYDIVMDEPAYTAAIGTNLDANTSKLVYSYASPVTPTSWYEQDLASGERRLLKQSFAGDDFDKSRYQVKRLHVRARDGANIPVTLMYQRGFQPQGKNPAFLLGYGSYGISYDANFFSHMPSLVDRGFVFALAHIRGGQEMGRDWYEQGKLLHKKNTFTDYIDVAQALIEQGWSAPEQLVGSGRSAGGLLMGAVANMAPQLFNTLVVGVPFVDVVTTMLDESIPLTTYEYDEWGNPNQREYYDYMLSYSPYDNVSAQAYPNIYVGTGLWDSAVQYWEPAKWVAKLRHLKTDNNQLVMYTDMNAGHRGNSGRFQRQRDYAREFVFILQQLGMTSTQ